MRGSGRGLNGYGSHHLAHQVGTSDGIDLRLIKKEAGLEPLTKSVSFFLAGSV
ncbi:MAG: hypothetical protein U5L72_17820 [Bacteroidales bacterium]|nr:hypothetical protein [Bacteroidales bacterium]